jgi:multidrug efflux pump subunit AcrA (membrane-fusion protein)
MLPRHDASFFTVVALLPFALAACTHADSSDDPRTQSRLVRVATVRAAVETDPSFTGIVAARVQSDLGFRVSGKIVERLVDTGQLVKRGQPLMRIDAADLRLAGRAHEEAVAAATARARQTQDLDAR